MIRALAIAAAIAACAAPASARSLGDRIRDMPDEEWVYQGSRAVELGLTAYCAANGKCEEVGVPKLVCGARPSAACLAGFGVVTGFLSAAITSAIQDRDPAAARTVARVKMFVGAGVVGWNLSVVW
ncbi:MULTISPECIES: hypothetical protein [unclassified Sphingomonas]|uniref:hypothetical protein n=1 Tax=unclassified Sphingomonas TaxID=196159 RepID=UPI0006FDDC7C|nr:MULTISPECIES: hypothetical protein [unclassified Sphingomonas]KQX19359.1 hypothetical protein ASD17_12520 [Sphingomonas sp. Root1294]KQY65562.1 hypothetical protein ASD39_15720 [Sphingomonas sp. Root50]KRB95137.1 hypothetical protein ASE22_04335 [Sphingomonas sp. Root720]